MIKRAILIGFVIVGAYAAVVAVQIFVGGNLQKKNSGGQEEERPAHKIYSFAFTKFTSTGEKELEIEGNSANILSRTVELMNVVAKAYAEETPVTITADQGQYDKAENKVHLQKNVVATTEDGTRLLAEELDIHPSERMMETAVETQVKKDNIDILGTGARGDSNLKKVRFKKNVTVVVQDPDKKNQAKPTTITCDGPLVIDYEKNIAHFKDHVVAQDERGQLTADNMDVYYNKTSRRVSKIVAVGNVVIENPDGNKTYSDNVVYLAEEGKIILGGDAEVLYYEGNQTGLEKGIL